MKVSQQVFDSLVSPNGGPEISFSIYHECLHSIAFTHAKVLSLPRHKFIDPASPANDDGTVSVQFLPHWRKHLLLPLFLRLMRIYIKPQLRLTDADYLQITTSFESLNPADINDVLGLSVKSLGRHLHILRSITLLEHICGCSNDSPLLDYFLHLGGDPMIVLGDILIRDDVQHTVSLLLDSVGSPSLHAHRHSPHSRSHSHRSRSSRSSQSSSIGSRTGTRISIQQHSLAHVSPILDPMLSPVPPTMTDPSPDLATISHQKAPEEQTPIAQPTVLRSTRFPNVDVSAIRKPTPLPRVTILHGQNGTPVQTSIPFPAASTAPGSLHSSPLPRSKMAASDPSWDKFQNSHSAFAHAPISRQHVLQNRALAAPSTFNLGATWTHYNLDPNDTRPIVDQLTNSIPPWRAYRPDHDSEMLHFPAAVPNVYVDRDLFLSSFTRPWENKNQADFLKHFPPLPAKATTRDLLPFYNKIVPHCRGYYIFVPPLSTLRSGLIMGTWFADLTNGLQSECLYHFSSLLLAAL